MTLTNHKTYEDRIVRLHELIDATAAPVLEGYTFRRCKISGPVVLWLDPTGSIQIEGCGFNAPDLESILWVNMSHVAFVGVTAVRNCSFISCEMARGGFGGSPAQISDLRQILSGRVNGATGPDRRS
jgi:hypothetical protein